MSVLHPSRADLRLRLLVTAAAGAALVLHLVGVAGLPALPGALELPFWLLVVVAAAAERATVHLHFRGHTHTLCLSEAALVLGLFSGPPSEAVLALVLGGAAVRLAGRQAARKQVFNGVAAALEATVAASLLHLLLDGAPATGAHAWLAAMASLGIAGLLGAALVTLVISSQSESRGTYLADLPDLLVPSALNSLTGTSTAIAAAVLLAVDPAAVLVLVLPGVVLFVAYRSHLRQQQEAERVGFLLGCSRALAADPAGGLPAAAVLAAVRARFGADEAALVLFDPDRRECADLVRDTAGRVSSTALTGAEALTLRALVAAAPADTATELTDAATDGLVRLLAPAVQAEGGLAATLHGNHRLVGLLVVGRPLAGLATRDPKDLLLLAALAQQSAAALENDQLRRLQDQLRFQADHDTLTGLPNRRLFASRLEEALPDGPAVLFIDLDEFKAVNDTYGHAAGDALLQHCAERLAAAVPPGATAARLGGDEFAVLLPGPVGLQSAQVLAQALLATLGVPVDLAGTTMPIRASVGLVAPDGSARTTGDLMRHADIAMYEAKRRGKGRVVQFEPSQQDAVVLRSELERDLEDAVRNSSLEVALQPITCLTSGRLVGLEALARWSHPVRGPVPPQDFIGIAEQSELIHQLGRQVMDAAWQHQVGWREADPDDAPYVSVNLSPRQLEHPDLVPELLAALRLAGARPRDVVIEITESCLVRDPDRAAGKLGALRAAGLRIALDDFGTGWSSLHLLRTLPVDILKLDRSFVAGLVASPEDQAVVRAVVDLATGLRMLVVAEGVETTAQADLLRRLGCQYGQGYLFARPLDPAAADAYVRRASGSPLPRQRSSRAARHAVRADVLAC